MDSQLKSHLPFDRKSMRFCHFLRFFLISRRTFFQVTVLFFLKGLGDLQAASLQLGFAGDYAPANWTFNPNGGDGAVNLIGIPAFVTVTGNDNGVLGIFTDVTITATAGGQVSFNWDYFTDTLVWTVSDICLAGPSTS